MLQGARRRIELLIGRRSAFPAPRAPADVPGLRERIVAWHEGAPERYARLFLQGRPLFARRRERDLFADLSEAGLVERLAPSVHQPCVRLFPLYGRFLAADLFNHREPDQVFSLMFEQVYLVRNMDIRAADHVLELCLGSGVNSLFAADSAAAVSGVDLNPRALAFARFNQALNPAATSVEMLEGSLFAPLAGRRFDTILVNPPFELVPEGESWFLHSDGGEDGLDVVRAILREAPAHLEPQGRFQVITWSPVGPHGPLLVDLLREAFPAHRLSVHVLDEGPLEGHLEAFRGRPGHEAHRRRLAERGIERVQFLYVHSAPSSAPGVEVSAPEAEVAACHAIADAWL